ncbi:MAG: pseudouridine synthase [Oscillospiraceae bacterium]
MALMRLDRILSAKSSFSRREAKSLVRDGLVTADGVKAVSPEEKYDPETAVIAIGGVPLDQKTHHYIMMNKPAGMVSSTEDPRDSTVLELLDESLLHLDLFPAGRLDKDSEGLLILTDDGVYCHSVISPKKNVNKIYYIETFGVLTEADCRAFEDGIVLGDGMVCRPGRLEILESGDVSRALVTICEGKYHQVKRMTASLGKPVKNLRRISIGALILDESLKPGQYRELSEAEAKTVFS